MRFEADKVQLYSALQVVTRAASSSAADMMLSNVLLKAGEGELVLQATDNKISIRCRVPAQVADTGEVAVQGSFFQEIVGALQGLEQERVVMEETSPLVFAVRAGEAEYKLTGVDARSFPLISEVEAQNSFTVPSSLFREMLRQVTVVNSPDLVKQNFDMVLFESRDGWLGLVATDTVRLALRREELAELPSFSVVVPMHACVELQKVLPPAGDVKVMLDEDQICFRFDDTEFIARLSNRRFPDYEKIVPAEHSREFVLDRRELLEHLKGVLPVARNNKHKIYVETSENEKDSVVLHASYEGREARRKVPAEVQGEPVKIAFNARFIMDFLSVVDGERVYWGVSSSVYPATFKPADGGMDYVYILMPITV